jgi:uncharacterized protein (TIGR02646 family)
MRRLRRPRLGRKAWVWLSLRAREVLADPDPKRKAADLWQAVARHRYRAEVHAALQRAASGVGRCMYCEDSAAQPIEHFWPKSEYPERAFCWENLLVVCDVCNRYKARTFPLDEWGLPLLIDPTAEDPALHLILNAPRGELVATDGSRKGNETIRILRLNRAELRRGRLNAWFALPVLLERYARALASDRPDQAAECERVVREHPFSAVLHFLVRVLDLPDPGRYLHDTADVEVLRSVLPDLRRWVETIEGAPAL